MQLIEGRAKELNDFSPALLKYIRTNNIDINSISNVPTKDRRIIKIIEFLRSSSGSVLKNEYKELYGLLVCCVHQKLATQGIEPFVTQGKATLLAPIKKAIEDCINRFSNAIYQLRVQEPQLRDTGSPSLVADSIISKSAELIAQAKILKALNDSLRSIGVAETTSFSATQCITQLNSLVTNPAVRNILRMCAQRNYPDALRLLNATYTDNDLLTQRFKESLAALVHGDFVQFDPQVGDELCEVRALLLILLRDGVCDLPCLRMFELRTDIAALMIFSSYLLTFTLQGINRGMSKQPLINTLCGENRLTERAYSALKKFLSSISIFFLRDIAKESRDEVLISGCNKYVFVNAAGCITMPFYCSIKAFVYAIKRYNVPIIFRIMKVTGYCQNMATGPCNYIECNSNLNSSAALIYECKHVPRVMPYMRDKMSPMDESGNYQGESSALRLIQSCSTSTIILQDAAQHDQFINPTPEVAKSIGLIMSDEVDAKVCREREIVRAIFCQSNQSANEYQEMLNAAQASHMDEFCRRCQQPGSDTIQEEISLIVSHVFAADKNSYMKGRYFYNSIRPGRRVCSL